ncbi:type I methionyl aminopeptidase [Aneurinibacillus aneurinilyticus]|nr:type I methionyl aminopeptidase [Aneurinibacillus aneurinilyticus]MED0704673.1 type I methionyl aminopeptidase [Aneurinibacillus aneurinilyticus]MED0724009.1 type I methionyl aminopeptidase [Aneurinibacillus aneurinilyticus]MED0732018.1 type I methionyl aminopeptidase [Aneurinibacillus aneurinilyticus]MED0741613.1 type I methionyl aminopeptidase [Aneurinibacillus aneurinilyticus]
MIILKTAREISLMKEAGEILAACHKKIASLIEPGITTREIDNFTEKFLKKHKATPEQKGYRGFPFATCASVNDVIAHGFPSKTPLKDGDIVTIDMVVNLNGWLADSAWTYPVGTISAEAQRLLTVTRECLNLGIEKALVGNRIGDVTHAIQTHAEGAGFSVVRDLLGHGIGQSMHEEPTFMHVGKPGKGARLKEGMVFTIEPMINVGTYKMYVEDDGWTARTLDGSLSAQYEHTIAITKDGPLILTQQ